MTTRCKHGDLAIVINDEPGCSSNIGRVVEVIGPCRPDCLERISWLIRPLTLDLFRYVDRDNSLKYLTRLDHKIRHPDAWLMPIKSENSETEEQDESVEEVL
jgi:hypothetical protein